MFSRCLSLASSTQRKFHLPPNISQLLGLTSNDSSPILASTSGWVRSIRKQKNVTFAVISDGSVHHGLQAVLVRSGTGADPGYLKNLTNGCAVRLTGHLVPSPGKGQSHELVVDERKGGLLEVLGACDPDAYPIQKQALSLEHLREHVHLRARTAHTASMIRMRDRLRRALDSWFDEQGFTYVHTPILTSSDAEGAGEAFSVTTGNTDIEASTSTPPSTPFFGTPAFLTVSSQLHLEALSTALARVYTLSPCFRAERGVTGRHLAEFWMLEAEWVSTQGPMSAADGNASIGPQSIEEVCSLIQGCLRSVVGPLVNGTARGSDDVRLLWETSAGIEGHPDGREERLDSLKTAFKEGAESWARMTYTQAIEELTKWDAWVQSIEAGRDSDLGKSKRFEQPAIWGQPLRSEHERWLAEVFVGGPVFVTDYPRDIKPFYVRENDNIGTAGGRRTVACVDLLVPHVGELVGGSVREERLEVLQARMVEAGMRMPLNQGGEDTPSGTSASGYSWYEDIRRYGGAPHAGFGLGFERLVGWVGTIENVRECIPMPRWAGKMLL